MFNFLKKAGDTVFALRFLRLLTMPYKKTAAFKHGVIDKDGEKIKKPETSDEKASYTLLIRLVFNLRRLLAKVPLIGRSILTNYASALFLIKESSGASEEAIIFTLSEAYNFDYVEAMESLNESAQAQSILDGPGFYMLEDEMINVVNDDPIGTFMDINIYEGITRDDRVVRFSAEAVVTCG